MKKIGLLSDTHNYIDNNVLKFFKDCNEIWHAGDIGSIELAEKINVFKPLRAVYGNIDGQNIKINFPRHLRFQCENVDVWITHIGGYPPNYNIDIRKEIQNNPPKLFICGHSHILKVQYDKNLSLLHINPGAAGKSGLHKVRTVVRFVIDQDQIKDLEILEIKR